MVYGLTEKKIKKIENYHDEDGKILCLACYQEGKRKYSKIINTTHLKYAHAKEFENVDSPIEHYRKLYPGAVIRIKGLKHTVSGGYKKEKAKSILAEIKKHGGISKWAEREGLELYRSQKKLADSLQAEGDFTAARVARKEARELLVQFLPSRNTRDTDGEIREPTKEDKEALGKLDELLDLMKKNLKQTKSDAVIAGGAWYDRGSEVPVLASSKEIPKSV